MVGINYLSEDVDYLSEDFSCLPEDFVNSLIPQALEEELELTEEEKLRKKRGIEKMKESYTAEDCANLLEELSEDTELLADELSVEQAISLLETLIYRLYWSFDSSYYDQLPKDYLQNLLLKIVDKVEFEYLDNMVGWF